MAFTSSQPLDKVLSLLQRVKERADGSHWDALCPAHDDKHPSLSVGIGEDNRVLLYCHKGCTVEAIVGALGLQMTDLFEPREGQNGHSEIVAVYDYKDEAGCLLFQTVRFYPKKFAQRRKARSGDNGNIKHGWVWKLDGVPRVLYRLPELLAADPSQIVFVAEGEKDVEALRRLGLMATCNPMGAKKWLKTYNEALRGRRVVILPDNDEDGREHARLVYSNLFPVAASVTILELPDLREKGDVYDWIFMGGTGEKLLALCLVAMRGGAPPPSTSDDPVVVDARPAAATPVFSFPPLIPASQLQKQDPTEAWLWEGILNRGGITLLTALWKAGKTTLLAHLLKSLETGADFCGLKTQACRTLYVTEESETRWAERRDALLLSDAATFLIRPFKGRPRFELWKEFLGHLTKVQKEGNFDLIMFDTLPNLWPVKDENDAAQVGAALMPLHEPLAAGKKPAALNLIHHARKSDGSEATASRGSGALTAFVDTIIEFRRFKPNDRKDRRRIITGYGRWEETPDEVVVELTDEGFTMNGSRSSVMNHDLGSIILSLLPTEAPGLTTEEIFDRWPGEANPNRTGFYAALKAGLEQGFWHRTGGGGRGNPFRYWRAPASDARYEDDFE